MPEDELVLLTFRFFHDGKMSATEAVDINDTMRRRSPPFESLLACQDGSVSSGLEMRIYSPDSFGPVISEVIVIK